MALEPLRDLRPVNALIIHPRRRLTIRQGEFRSGMLATALAHERLVTLCGRLCDTFSYERYIHLLRVRRRQGDVMAEVRGGKPDRRLETSFARLYDRGTSHIDKASVKWLP